MRTFRLTFPANVTAEAVAAILRIGAAEPRGTVWSPRPPIDFRTVIGRNDVAWWVTVPNRLVRPLQAASERELPGLDWSEDPLPRLELTAASELRIDSGERLLATDLAEPTIARLLGVARRLRKSESLLVQWQIGAWLPRSPIPPARAPQPRSIWNLPEWGNPVRDSEQVSAARKKQTEHIFGAVGRLAVSGATGARADQLLASMAGSYQLLRAPGVGVSRRHIPARLVLRRATRQRVSQIDPPVRATATELAGLIGWPIGNPVLPGVRYPLAPRLPLDERSLVTARPGDRVLGVSGLPAQATNPSKRVVLPPRDGLRHTHLIGPTGTGKSTLLAHLILADITAGRGVVVIDPKGDLVPDVLARVPASRRDSVAVLDATDAAPIGFNPLTGHDRMLGVDGVLHVLHSIWSGSWGPRLGDVLHSGLATLAATPGHSLAELPLLLSDPVFRRPLVRAAVAGDPLGLGTFWPWFDGLSDDMRAQVLSPVMNKLRGFISRPALRAVLGQAEPRFDLASVFTEGRALLVRLPKGELGTEGAQLLGSTLVSHLWRLTLSRTAIHPSKRRPVFFYLDEFQEFLRLPLDLADALVQSRGLGVGLVLAHQHLEQLDRPVRSAVLANVGSRIAFRLDHDDATTFAHRSGGQLTADNLSGLSAYEAYASLMVDGEATPFGSLATLPLPDPTVDPAVIQAASRARFGVEAAATEQRLRDLLGGVKDPSGESGVLGGRRAPRGES